MKLSEILKDLTILDTNADLNADIADVCYDSRQAKPGSLFVAITGAETDGHKYIPMARDKGAACVVCQHAPETDIPMWWWRTPAGRWRSSPAIGSTTPPGS